MISGRFAFQGLSEYLTWQKIKQLDYSFPENFDENAKDLVQRLLVRISTLGKISALTSRRCVSRKTVLVLVHQAVITICLHFAPIRSWPPCNGQHCG